MINIKSGEIFTDSVFSEFEQKMQLEPRKHTWGRLIGLQQARASTMKRIRLDDVDQSGDSGIHCYRNIEVKISGLSGELSKAWIYRFFLVQPRIRNIPRCGYFTFVITLLKKITRTILYLSIV